MVLGVVCSWRSCQQQGKKSILKSGDNYVNLQEGSFFMVYLLSHLSKIKDYCEYFIH